MTPPCCANHPLGQLHYPFNMPFICFWESVSGTFGCDRAIYRVHGHRDIRINNPEPKSDRTRGLVNELTEARSKLYKQYENQHEIIELLKITKKGRARD